MGLDITAEREQIAGKIRRKEEKDRLREQKRIAYEQWVEKLATKRDPAKLIAKFICSQCGYLGKPKLITKGNILFEAVLWLMFLLPGIIYSIWRHATRFTGCPQCQGHMIKTSSPIGRKLLIDIHNTPPREDG